MPSMFDQMTAMPNPYSMNQYNMPNMLAGMPGMDGQMGQLLAPFIGQMMTSIMGNNYVPMPFGRQQINMQSLRQAMDQANIRNAAIQAGAVEDTQTIQRMLEGAIRAANGGNLTQRDRQAAAAVAGDIGQVAPMLAMMADASGRRNTFASLFGDRGSAILAGMDIAAAGRFQVGPGGVLGISGDEAGRITRQLHNEMFGQGADLSRMRGLRSDEASAALLEMTRLGVGPAGGLRADNMVNVKRDLEKMAPAIKAMQEVFGENGNPNAPMPQIFRALETITQGNVRNMDPARVAQMVRDLNNVAKLTGQSMDVMMGAINTAAVVGDRLGLDRSFAPQAAMSASLQAHTLGARGGIGGFFGGMTKEQYQVGLTALTQSAAASDLGNRMGLVAYLGGAANGGKGLTGQAAELFTALKEGRTTFGGDNRSIYEVLGNQAELNRVLISGGATQEQIASLQVNREFLQEYVQRYDLGTLAQRGQGALEVNGVVSRQFSGAAFGVLVGRGVDRETAAAQSRAIGDAAAQLVRSLTPEEMKDPAKAIGRIAAALKAQFPELRNMTDAEVFRIAEAGWSRSERAMKTETGQSLRNMLQLTDPKAAADARMVQGRVQTMSRVQDVLAGMGNSNVIQRLSSLLQRNDVGSMDLKDLAALLAGGVPREGAAGRLQGLLGELEGQQARLADLTKDPTANMETIDQARKEIARILGDIADVSQPVQPGAASAGASAAGGAAGSIGGRRMTTDNDVRASTGADRPEPDQGTNTRAQNISGTLRLEWPPVLARFIGGLAGGNPRNAT